MNKHPRLAVVEDDRDLCDSLVEFLAAYGFPVWGVHSGEALYERLVENPADVVVLDVQLPDADGFQVAKTLQGQAIGIVMLTARGTLADRLNGLSSGADTYLVKPIDLVELAANIDAVARRLVRQVVQTATNEAAWRLEQENWHIVSPDGQSLSLTGKEFALLRYLAEAKGAVMNKARLASLIDGYACDTGPNRLDVLLCRLRKKAEQTLGRKLPVKAVNGQGYALTVRCDLK